MDNYLIHYGILGMKWGIRRYQNKDGTLTEAGKNRLNKLVKKDEEYRQKIDKANTVYDQHKIRTKSFKNGKKIQKLTGQVILSDADKKEYEEYVARLLEHQLEFQKLYDDANEVFKNPRNDNEKLSAELDMELWEEALTNNKLERKAVLEHIAKYEDFKVRNGIVKPSKTDEQILDDYRKRGGKLYTSKQLNLALDSVKKELSEYRKKPFKDRDPELEDLMEMEIQDLEQELNKK